MISDNYIKSFYKEIEENLEGEYKIILEPNRDLKEKWIEYDQVKWEIEEPMQNLIKKLQDDNSISFEDKVLEIYKFICLNYIYDDNVLYFFKKDTSDINNIKYIAVDWYGRIVGKQWQENRKKHNRRICYEFSRFYAKAINQLIENNNIEAVMVGDKENLHYVVGLTGDEYSVILDLDDFNKIKDLTRLKLGLTIDGIKILRDKNGKIQKAIDKFNKKRLNELKEVEDIEERQEKENLIQYLTDIVNVLKKYKIDSQGFMEYMRTKIEKQGIEIEKIWKEVKEGSEKRYIRCLWFELDSKTYLLDSVEQILIEIKKEDLDRELFVFNPEEHQYDYFGG